jgi:demethylmenaquinone methyltransferase/2-methoxy-6-polyprenyl-1,4-benzoquinol methylase
LERSLPAIQLAGNKIDERYRKQRIEQMTHDPEISRVMRSKAQARSVYDRLSRWYDLLAGSSERPYTELGLSHLSLCSGERALEIGCGTGHATAAIAAAVGEPGRLHAIDLSRGMLRAARRKILKPGDARQPFFQQADAVRLPFAPASFDAVFMSFVLELFDTPEIPLVLAECRRVLRPSGRLGIVAMARTEHQNLPLRIYEWFHEHLPAYVDCRPIYLRAALASAGFQSQHVITQQMWGLPVDICIAQPPQDWPSVPSNTVRRL